MNTSIIVSAGPGGQAPYVVADQTLPSGQIRIDIPHPGVVRRDPPIAPLIGLSPTPAEHSRWHDVLPGAHSGRVFYKHGKGQPRMADSAIAGLYKRGITPHVSTKDPATSAQLIAEFNAIPDGHRYKRSYWHERQGDDVDPAMCLAQDKLLRQVRDDHPRGEDITLVGVHNAWAARFKDRRDWREYVSTDMDRIGWDIYLDERFAWEAPESALGLPIHSLAEFGYVDWEITELGASQTRIQRSLWIPAVVDAAAAYGCDEVILWCAKKTIQDKQGRDVVLDYRPTDTPTLLAYRDLIDLNAGARI